MNEILNMSIYILKGLGITCRLYAATFIFSTPLGIMLALISVSKFNILKKLIAVYAWVFRGTPLLLQLFFVYYGLPLFGITLSAFTASALTFVINYTAYLIEIFRGGLESIDKGQYEASKVLGLTYAQTMREIILPQAIRRVLPSLSNEAITLIKDTALVSVIGMAEILRNSKEIVSREFTIIPFLIAAVIYLLLSSVVVLVFKNIENRNKVMM